MFLLDTDSYTHLLFAHPRMVERAHTARSDGAVIGITVITKVEVLRGRLDSLLKASTRAQFLAAQERLGQTEVALSRILIVALDHAALDQYERIKGKRGIKNIGRADLLIGSIALANDATLVTRNWKHFRLINGLRFQNWVD